MSRRSPTKAQKAQKPEGSLLLLHSSFCLLNSSVPHLPTTSPNRTGEKSVKTKDPFFFYGPDAELRAALRFHAVADGDDHVEVVINGLVDFPVGGSSCIICTYCFLRQFPFLEEVADVLGDDGAFPLEQIRYLRLGQPDRLVLTVSSSITRCLQNFVPRGTKFCRPRYRLFCHNSFQE